MAIYQLDENDFGFPPAELADAEMDGLLAIGGGYEPERLLNAYAAGIFPWPVPGVEQVTWFSPDPRFVLFAGELHVPKSLKKVMRSGRYTVTVDQAFPEVIHACGSVPRPGQDGTWITDALAAGYCELHRLGFAHSVEAWRDGVLAGGLYGVRIGRCFFGESMFARQPDASKCAFATFAQRLFDAGTPWIDCQVRTDHLARFGAREIPRAEYLRLLAQETTYLQRTRHQTPTVV